MALPATPSIAASIGRAATEAECSGEVDLVMPAGFAGAQVSVAREM